MSDSVLPHRWQPTRLPCPWDSPGKNSGVGCHFLLQCIKGKRESEVAQSRPTQRPHGMQPTRLLRPWDFPGKSTGVGCHRFLRRHQGSPSKGKSAPKENSRPRWVHWYITANILGRNSANSHKLFQIIQKKKEDWEVVLQGQHNLNIKT